MAHAQGTTVERAKFSLEFPEGWTEIPFMATDESIGLHREVGDNATCIFFSELPNGAPIASSREEAEALAASQDWVDYVGREIAGDDRLIEARAGSINSESAVMALSEGHGSEGDLLKKVSALILAPGQTYLASCWCDADHFATLAAEFSEIFDSIRTTPRGQ